MREQLLNELKVIFSQELVGLLSQGYTYDINYTAISSGFLNVVHLKNFYTNEDIALAVRYSTVSRGVRRYEIGIMQFVDDDYLVETFRTIYTQTVHSE